MAPKSDTSLAFSQGSNGARIEGRDGQLHYLNQTAAVVWLLADGTRDLPALADAVAHVFDLRNSPIDDVEHAIAQFEEHGLLQAG